MSTLPAHVSDGAISCQYSSGIDTATTTSRPRGQSTSASTGPANSAPSLVTFPPSVRDHEHDQRQGRVEQHADPQRPVLDRNQPEHRHGEHGHRDEGIEDERLLAADREGEVEDHDRHHRAEREPRAAGALPGEPDRHPGQADEQARDRAREAPERGEQRPERRVAAVGGE